MFSKDAVFSKIKRRIVSAVVAYLTEPIKLYNPAEATNLTALKNRLKEGDVLLICGNTRISHIVKVLTRSQWSHVVLYVGNRPELLRPVDRTEWGQLYGEEALRHLVVDADPLRGVHLSPVNALTGLMVRHCRAEALTAEDASRVVHAALEKLGRQYDIRHILRLCWFFVIPWGLLPESLRRFITDFTLSETDTICSRILSEAFYSVGYPIRPIEVIENQQVPHGRAAGYLAGITSRGRSAAKLLLGGRFRAAAERLNNERYFEIRQKGTRYVTPSDYDLSRFFSVIKNPTDFEIDYQRARQLPPEQAITPRKRRWPKFRSE